MSRRLLLLSSEFPPGPGGIGTHAYQLATHLSHLGWNVHVAAPQPYVDKLTRETFNSQLPFPIVTFEYADTLLLQLYRRISKLIRLCNNFRPDVILASGSRALWSAAFLSRLFRTPWLAVGHGTEFLTGSASNSVLTRLSIRSASATVAVSKYTATLMQEQTNPSGPIYVIPNGADERQFHPKPSNELRRNLNLQKKRVLLTVGRVSKRKAQDVVIRALPAILQHHPDLVYLLVGLPEEQTSFQQLAEQLGIAEHVYFTGVVPQETLPQYYNLADIFVLTSRKAASGDVEGYGIVVLEAALCGKPAVVSQSGGLTEAVQSGQTGLVVPPDDPQATAEALLSLLGDRELYQRMAQQALCRARQATWNHRVAAYDQLLRQLIAS